MPLRPNDPKGRKALAKKVKQEGRERQARKDVAGARFAPKKIRRQAEEELKSMPRTLRRK